MANEEATLALLEQGRIEAENTEAQRQARYLWEDEERTKVRAAEDQARDAGATHREEVKAALETALAERLNTPEKQAADQIAELSAKVAALEAAAKPPEPVVVHPTDPVIPVV